MTLLERDERNIERGYKKGLEQGIEKKAREDTQNLKHEGVSDEIISKVTGLPIEIVREL